VKRLARHAGRGNDHTLRAVKLRGFDNFSDCVLWRWSILGVFTLEHPKLPFRNSKHVGALIARPADDTHVVETIGQQ
jgi:hypothetical protein